MTSLSAALPPELQDLPRSDLEAAVAMVEEEIRQKEAAGELKPPPLFRWTTEPSDPPNQLITVGLDGIPRVHVHAGQDKARKSKARFVLILSGAQSGKTALGPWWLLDEMRAKGPGNYLLVAPTFRLLDKQAVPTLNRAFSTVLKLGSLSGGSSGEFRISEEGHAKIWPALPYEPTRIVFGYAENPDSLESLTAKAAWLDECGQRAFKQASHEAIQSRLAINQGRILYTSTPYEHGWLKYDVFEPAERNRRADKRGLPRNPADEGYDSISYESRMNPVFSQAEWDRQKLVLPAWRFDMRYRGLFTKPAGAIYDCFDRELHTVSADFIPDPTWKIHCGVDFGAPNFAAIFFAEEPAAGGSRYYAFAEYRPDESKTSAEHVAAMRAIIGRNPDQCVGGAKSEGQWRAEFAAAGWPIRPPDQPDVEVGIGRVYEVIKTDRLRVSLACEKLLEELANYSRPVDEEGMPMDGIEDKDLFHGLDSARYILSWLGRKQAGWFFNTKVGTVGGRI